MVINKGRNCQLPIFLQGENPAVYGGEDVTRNRFVGFSRCYAMKGATDIVEHLHWQCRIVDMQVKDRQTIEGEKERITVVPENVDDLWHLHYIIAAGDLVSGDTTRRIQRQEENLRETGGEREHLHVTLEVEETEFAKFANRLRISGIITDTSREDVIGSHHTINVEAHDEIAIQKAWQPDQLDRLEEAREASENPDVVIVTVEEGEAHIHTVAQYGVEERTSFTGTTGKGEFARDRSELFASIGEALTHLDVDAIILAGPGFTKQDVYDYIESNYPDLTDMITMVDTSSVGGRGVHEVLKRGAVEDVQKESRISEEATLIDELRKEIAAGETAVYGIDAVQQAADYGAIEHLLILDERLRRERGDHGDWDVDINELITSVEQKGGEVTVFSHEFSPGQQLQNLGGIAALLRYRID